MTPIVGAFAAKRLQQGPGQVKKNEDAQALSPPWKGARGRWVPAATGHSPLLDLPQLLMLCLPCGCTWRRVFSFALPLPRIPWAGRAGFAPSFPTWTARRCDPTAQSHTWPSPHRCRRARKPGALPSEPKPSLLPPEPRPMHRAEPGAHGYFRGLLVPSRTSGSAPTCQAQP